MDYSLRGITFGSPEYVRITKHAEKRGEITQLIDNLDQAVGDIIAIDTHLTDAELARIQRILAEFH